MKLKRMFLYIAVLATMAWAWGCNEEDMQSTAAGASTIRVVYRIPDRKKRVTLLPACMKRFA